MTLTKSELRCLLNHPPVPDVLSGFEMDGKIDVEELVCAIIKARDLWRAEQWPPGTQGD
jgi:hypothetical protein